MAVMAEKAAVLAKKEFLMEHIDIQELIDKGPENAEEELRLDIFNRVKQTVLRTRSWRSNNCG
ncbi:hypothetical protein O9992_16970 [Vibrio lentus]|nr:hypothetical protein [Vibrio lentus]